MRIAFRTCVINFSAIIFNTEFIYSKNRRVLERSQILMGINEQKADASVKYENAAD